MSDQFESDNQPQVEFSARLTAALSACFYAAYVVALSAGMLMVNAVVCLTLYAALPKFENKEFAAQAGQFFFFIVPVLFMVLEWHLIDRIGRLFRSEN